jgi:ABC-type glycerol-3-phosphate transport system substrate-binding protein
VLLQYIAAGGTLVDDTGSAALNSDALLALLDYYAQGVATDVFDPAVLDYATLNDYWNTFVTGDAHMITVNSRAYLSLKSSVQNVGLVPLPTATGVPLTMLDGWMWVVTTHNPDRQQRALAFLAWMMRVGQQSAFTEAFGVVPSQGRAIRLWNDEVYADFVQMLVETAVVFPEERRNNAAAAALQAAVAAVLKGASPEVAATDALSSLVP